MSLKEKIIGKTFEDRQKMMMNNINKYPRIPRKDIISKEWGVKLYNYLDELLNKPSQNNGQKGGGEGDDQEDCGVDSTTTAAKNSNPEPQEEPDLLVDDSPAAPSVPTNQISAPAPPSNNDDEDGTSDQLGSDKYWAGIS